MPYVIQRIYYTFACTLTESSLPPYAVQFSYKPTARQRENGSFPCCVATVFTACLATVVSRVALLPDVVCQQRCRVLRHSG
jgi:hypothetical protein